MRVSLRNILVVLVVFLYAGTAASAAVGDDAIDDMDKMTIQNYILHQVRAAYFDTTVTTVDLLDAAIEGMIGELDPHSSYMAPETAENFNESIRGGFEGIGITFSMINDKITVIEVIEGGPSAKAGLKSRDKIVGIEGESAFGLSNDEVRDRLRGEKGSQVTVSVERPGATQPLEFVITRNSVELDSVSHSYMLDNETGYLAVSKFTIKTRFDVAGALAALKSEGMQNLVLDLRNNSGGSLADAVSVVDFFLSDGLIVETRGKRKVDNQKWFASGNTPYGDLPMIVLINHGSASASEIVAGALQDHDRALIVGQTSFGKGLVMNQFRINPRSHYLGSLILSVAQYYTPSGRLIQRPYKEGREQYIREGYDNVDPNAPGAVDTDAEVFHTDLGRKVYGGGGITPDIFVEQMPMLNRLETEIRRSNYCFEFADGYLERVSRFPEDFGVFLNEYSLPGDEMEKFRAFLLDKGITFERNTDVMDDIRAAVNDNPISAEKKTAIFDAVERILQGEETGLFDESRDFIQREIKQEIARMVWGSDERYKVWHQNDIELQEALGHFDRAEELLSERLALGTDSEVPAAESVNTQ